jgi:pimeloyl-ACP methyl ester carboxylesterase
LLRSASFAVSSVDGSPLFYETWGAADNARVPLLLLDGIGCDGYVWRYIRDEFTDRRNVHGHYRGHGRTPVPDDFTELTLATLADDAAAVLDDAKVASAVIIGHSMGVQVALEFTRRYRKRVRGLALLCGAPGHPLRTFRGSASLEKVLPTAQTVVSRIPSIVNRISKWIVPTKLAYEIAARTEIRRESVDIAAFMPYLEGIAQIDSRLFVAMLAAAAEHSAEDMMSSIDVPTLVIAGGKDGFTPPSRSHDIAKAVPGAILLELPDGSHTAPIEEPAVVNAAIQQLLLQIDSGQLTQAT